MIADHVLLGASALASACALLETSRASLALSIDQLLERDRRSCPAPSRSVLVLEEGRLAGIITQGDCAIKVLLPGLDAKQVLVKDVMTVDPITVKLQDPIEACTGLMASRNFRHLPVVEAGRVVGVISIGDVVKDSIRQMGQQIGFLETYIKGHSA